MNGTATVTCELLPGMPEPQPASMRQMTEREMLDLLHKRFGLVSQNGGSAKPRYVKAEHVRAKAGFDTRTADFVAVDTWESGRYAIHGAEIKVSRADWLRELKDPGKSAACMSWCTYWWLAVPDRAMVKDGELPDGWGLLTASTHGGYLRLRQAVAAPRRAVPPIPPESMASLLRAVARTAAARGAA